MGKIFKCSFLVFILFSINVFATVHLTGDYCEQNGVCSLDSLNVYNLTVNNYTTLMHTNLTGNLSIYGTLGIFPPDGVGEPLMQLMTTGTNQYGLEIGTFDLSGAGFGKYASIIPRSNGLLGDGLGLVEGGLIVGDAVVSAPFGQSLGFVQESTLQTLLITADWNHDGLGNNRMSFNDDIRFQDDLLVEGTLSLSTLTIGQGTAVSVDLNFDGSQDDATMKWNGATDNFEFFSSSVEAGVSLEGRLAKYGGEFTYIDFVTSAVSGNDYVDYNDLAGNNADYISHKFQHLATNMEDTAYMLRMFNMNNPGYMFGVKSRGDLELGSNYPNKDYNVSIMFIGDTNNATIKHKQSDNYFEFDTGIQVNGNAEFLNGNYNFTSNNDPTGFNASVVHIYSNSTQSGSCIRGYDYQDEYFAVCRVNDNLPLTGSGIFENDTVLFNSDGDIVFWNNDNGSFIFSADPEGNKNFTENVRFEVAASGKSFFYGELDYQQNNVSNINRLGAPDGSSIQFGINTEFSNFDQAIVIASNQSLPGGEITHAMVGLNPKKVFRTFQSGLPFAAGYMRNSQIMGEDFDSLNGTELSRCDVYWDNRNTLLNKTSSLDVDCNSNAYTGNGTGADLLVEDDIKLGGRIFADDGYEGKTTFVHSGTGKDSDFNIIDSTVHLRTSKLTNKTFGAGLTSDIETFDGSLGTYISDTWSGTASTTFCNSDDLCISTSSGTDEFVYKTFDFTNKTNVTAQFYYGARNVDLANDDYYLEVSNGSLTYRIWNITIVGTNNNIPSTISSVIDIPEELWNQSNVNVTFHCTTSNPSEGCYLDDSNVTIYDANTNMQEVTVLDAKLDLGNRDNQIKVNGTDGVMSLVSDMNVTFGEVGKPGGIRVRDSDDAGWTCCSFLNGNPICTICN